MNFFINESIISTLVIFAVIFISIGVSAIAHFSFSFLHFLLIFESIILSICLIISAGSVSFGKIEGDIAVLFIVAIVAAETAIAISLYIRATITPPARFKKNDYNYNKLRNTPTFKKKTIKYFYFK